MADKWRRPTGSNALPELAAAELAAAELAAACPAPCPAPARGPGGRFAKGWKGGPGNPLAAEVGKHRARLFKAARATDVDKALATIREVMGKGKDGDRLAAAKLLLDRLLGPALELDLIERLEVLEAAIFREENHGT